MDLVCLLAIWIEGIKIKVALYARVSKDDMTCENQIKVLQDWQTKNLNPNSDTWEYIKEEMSSRKTRPLKEDLVKRMRSGEIDTIVVVRIDRWARSLQELVSNIQEVVNRGARFIAILNGFDFQRNHFNASQQLMLNIFASFADFEREIIRERTLEGLARAKAEGKKGGRRKGWKCGVDFKGGGLTKGN